MIRRILSIATLCVIAGLTIAYPVAALDTFDGLRLPFDFAPPLNQSSGPVVVEDLNSRVLSFSSKGEPALLKGLSSPQLVSRDETGLLVALDKPKKWSISGYDNGEEKWRSPLAIATSGAGNPVGMYAREGIVWIIFQSPSYLRLFAYDGELLAETDITRWALSPFSVAVGPTGEAMVTNPTGPNLLRFSSSGSFIETFDVGSIGITRPAGVCWPEPDKLLLSDTVLGRVLSVKVDVASGLSVDEEGWRGFESPIRIHCSSRELWVLDSRAGKVQKQIREAR